MDKKPVMDEKKSNLMEQAYILMYFNIIFYRYVVEFQKIDVPVFAVQIDMTY